MTDDTGIRCASYTHARRHPMVLGRIAGWAPPFQLTITQVLVVLATFVTITWSWSTWSTLLPPTVSFMAAAGLPIAAGWAVRHVRLEGRSLARTVLGYLTLASTPRAGRLAGRPVRRPAPVRTNTAIWFASGSER